MASLSLLCRMQVLNLKPEVKIRLQILHPDIKLRLQIPNPELELMLCLAQQRLYEVGQLFVCYVFDLDVSVKYLKVTLSYTQKSVKFRSVFIFLQECQLIVGF